GATERRGQRTDEPYTTAVDRSGDGRSQGAAPTWSALPGQLHGAAGAARSGIYPGAVSRLRGRMLLAPVSGPRNHAAEQPGVVVGEAGTQRRTRWGEGRRAAGTGVGSAARLGARRAG